MLNEGNQIHNFISSSGSGTVINYGSGSTRQKVTVPTVPVPVPQHWAADTLNSPPSSFPSITLLIIPPPPKKNIQGWLGQMNVPE
jgi:hypothetical protein